MNGESATPGFPNARAALAALVDRSVSAMELTEAALARIAAVDHRIGAYRQLLAGTALDEARLADERFAAGVPAGPLAGLPVAVKENVDTVPAVCSAGLRMRRDAPPATRDAWITRRLRKAGAVVLGVTVSDPGAFGVRTAEVVHPVDPQLTVGGSSGGSAAALATGTCLAAIGTDTGGSIRIPAACCGLAGLKPTRERLPLDGVFPLVPSLDHVGPMTRDASDLETVFAALDPVGGTGNGKLGVVGYDPLYFADADPVILEEFERVLALLQRAGIACREVVLPHPDEVSAMHSAIFSTEAAGLYRSRYPAPEEDYPELARATFAHASGLSMSDYLDACRLRGALTGAVSARLREVDAILTPTLPVHRPVKAVDGFTIGGKWIDFTYALVRYTCLFNHTGHPAVAMPAPGSGDAGIPVSIQIVGAHDSDRTMVRFARQIETLPE